MQHLCVVYYQSIEFISEELREMASVAELDDKQLEALEVMRTTFRDADGTGMALDDKCFLRYLRAR